MRDRVLGIVVFVLGLGAAWYGRDLTAPISYEPVGPRAFPWLLAALLCAVGLWIAIRGSKPDPAAAPATSMLSWPVIAALLTVLAYGLSFQWLGFPIATCLLGVAFGRLFGGTWMQSLLTGLALGIGLFVLFDKLLDVVLPTGLLRTIL